MAGRVGTSPYALSDEAPPPAAPVRSGGNARNKTTIVWSGGVNDPLPSSRSHQGELKSCSHVTFGGPELITPTASVPTRYSEQHTRSHVTFNGPDNFDHRTLVERSSCEQRKNPYSGKSQRSAVILSDASGTVPPTSVTDRHKRHASVSDSMGALISDETPPELLQPPPPGFYYNDCGALVKQNVAHRNPSRAAAAEIAWNPNALGLNRGPAPAPAGGRQHLPNIKNRIGEFVGADCVMDAVMFHGYKESPRVHLHEVKDNHRQHVPSARHPTIAEEGLHWDPDQAAKLPPPPHMVHHGQGQPPGQGQPQQWQLPQEPAGGLYARAPGQQPPGRPAEAPAHAGGGAYLGAGGYAPPSGQPALGKPLGKPPEAYAAYGGGAQSQQPPSYTAGIPPDHYVGGGLNELGGGYTPRGAGAAVGGPPEARGGPKEATWRHMQLHDKEGKLRQAQALPHGPPLWDRESGRWVHREALAAHGSPAERAEPQQIQNVLYQTSSRRIGGEQGGGFAAAAAPPPACFSAGLSERAKRTSAFSSSFAGGPGGPTGLCI